MSTLAYVFTTKPLCIFIGEIAPGPFITKNISMLKSILVNKDFQIYHLIGWQHSCQTIRSQVRKSLLTNMDFSMIIT